MTGYISRKYLGFKKRYKSVNRCPFLTGRLRFLKNQKGVGVKGGGGGGWGGGGGGAHIGGCL